MRCRVFYELYLIEFRRSQKVLKSFVGNYAFDDIYSPIFIGSVDSGFLGFIWRFTIFPKYSTPAFYKICSDNSLSNCLWDCPIDSFVYNGECLNCHISCTDGCVRKTDCNLCIDPLCYICENFTQNCKECSSNAIFNQSSLKCECKETYYLDSGKTKCLPSKCKISLKNIKNINS